MSSRVAVFCRTFLPRSQTFVYDAVTRLTRYRATVFCKERDEGAQFPFDDVRVGWPGYAATRISPNFVAAFLRERFDVIHAQFGPSAIYALPYARLARLPLVVSFHGYDVPLLDQARPIRGPHRQYAWFGRAMLRRMTLGLCASEELRQMLIAHGVAQERLRTHTLGVDTRRFRPGVRSPGPARVLMIGRFVEKKGFRYGIEAFARAASRDAQLTIIGEGPLDEALRTLTQELGIAARVDFTGPLTHAQVLERMRDHDILLAPSVVAANGDRDSGLIVLREAAACGLVPIASRMGGLPDSVEDGETGFLTEMRDVDQLSERLQRLLCDAALRTRMSLASRDKMVREMDHSLAMPQLERAYDDARATFG
ncbi:MAG TPA: glycosyltransferase [Polyangiales bacterium]|nr:glycosyltransferase [Polyangiales bacterium]